MVYFVRALLAAGHSGIDSISDCVAALVAASAGWHQHRGGIRSHSRAALPSGAIAGIDQEQGPGVTAADRL